MTFPIDELTTGKVLCDMHYGLSQLEQRIEGFEVLHEARVGTPHGKHIVATILGTALGPRIVTPTAQNKLLYLIEHTTNSVFKAIYYYDSLYFSIVTFKAKV
jgi:hypothetical protein